MKTTIKNTITAKIDLTTEERAILIKAQDIRNTFLVELYEVNDITSDDLQEIAKEKIAEQSAFLLDDFNDIIALLILDGEVLTFEEQKEEKI